MGCNFGLVATNPVNDSSRTANQSSGPRSNGEIKWNQIEVLSEPLPGHDFNTDFSTEPEFVVENEKIYVVWQDRNVTNGAGTDYDIFYRHFDGNIWSEVEVISEHVPGQNFNFGQSGRPSIAVKNGSIYVVWEDTNGTNFAGGDSDIFYRTNLTGTCWGDIQVISEPVAWMNYNQGYSWHPVIDVENDKVYVAWIDSNNTNGAGTDYDILYRCNVTGAGWEDIQVISEPVFGQNFDDGQDRYPEIVVENGKIYLVWENNNNTNGAGNDFDIFYICNLTGTNWEDIIVISEPIPNQDNNKEWSFKPDIAVENDKIYVVWEDWENLNNAGNNGDIFYRYFNNSIWSEVQVISEPIPGQDFHSFGEQAAIAVENDKIYVVWASTNHTNGAGTDWDIFYLSNLTGSGWGPVQVISEPVQGQGFNNYESGHILSKVNPNNKFTFPPSNTKFR
jgi:hypothetical protein